MGEVARTRAAAAGFAQCIARDAHQRPREEEDAERAPRRPGECVWTEDWCASFGWAESGDAVAAFPPDRSFCEMPVCALDPRLPECSC